MIEKYGQKPESIHIELARELKNSKKQKENRSNLRDFNQAIRDDLKKFVFQKEQIKIIEMISLNISCGEKWEWMEIDGVYDKRSLGEIQSF